MNRFVWNLRYPGAEDIAGHPTRHSKNIGPYALPGKYQVELVVDGKSQTQNFEIVKDPNSQATQEDLKSQFDRIIAIRDKITQVNRMVLTLRDLRKQLNEVAASAPTLQGKAEGLKHKLFAMEDILIQYKATFRMQLHAMPVKLDDKLYTLAGHVLKGEARPTRAQENLFAEHIITFNSVRDQLNDFIKSDLTDFNTAAKRIGVKSVIIPKLP